MDNEDMSEIIQKLSSMLNNSSNQESNNNNNNNNENDDVSSHSNNIDGDTIQNILNNLNFNNQTSNNSTGNENNFNFDINTILKMKSVMDKINSNKNDPRSNLLLSLKPYLNNNRQKKLDQYMQFLNVSQIIDAFNPNGGGSNK